MTGVVALAIGGFGAYCTGAMFCLRRWVGQ